MSTPIDASFSVLKGEAFHPSVAGYMSRATPVGYRLGATVGGRVRRPDADALNRKLSAWRARPSMKDMREHQLLSFRPPVVRERFDLGTPISELQGDKSKTPEYAMDFHKDPDVPAVGPTGEIDEFAHLTDAQTPVIHTYGFSGFNDPMKERLFAMRDTDSPQRIAHEFYPEETGMDFRLDPTNIYNEVFRRSSDTPTDVAFSVLKPEEEVRKILPLVIPAAAAIYGGIQGAKNVRENKITDPVLGVVSREGGDSALSNLAEFGTGFAQGFVPGKAAKAGARAGARKIAARSSAKASGRRAQRGAVERQTGDAALARRLHPDKALQPRRTMSERALTGLGQPMGRLAPAVAVGAGLAYGGKQIADAFGNMSMGGSGTAAPSGSGMGASQQQQRTQSNLSDPSAGNQNLQNVGVGQTGREQIWQQGGSGTFKGETMTFTHYDGNIMLRKTLEDLDKMHCATAKADCPKCGKDCKCDEKKKADDKKGKKPAHGMVIVIGSKNAGPGPSTDGKRDSKD